MSHPLEDDNHRRATFCAIAVTVTHKNRTLILESGSGVTETKVIEWILVPNWPKVVLSDGTPIEASGQFWMTSETIDPFHALTDRPIGNPQTVSITLE